MGHVDVTSAQTVVSICRVRSNYQPNFHSFQQLLPPSLHLNKHILGKDTIEGTIPHAANNAGVDEGNKAV